MRGAPGSMEVIRPRSAGEAVKAYGRDPNAVPFAGGTDIMVLWNLGLLNGRTILDLSALREWSRIRKVGNGIKVGSLATHSQIQQDPLLRRSFPLLVEACAVVGAVQIQNRGTIGGNIANASPAGDTFPALAVYEARVHAVSAAGKRAIPFGRIFAGVKKTTLNESELIESVELPFIERPSRSLFRKVGTRSAQAISKTVVAGLLWLDADRKVRELRFAVGSLATTVRRLRKTEEAVRGKRLTPDVIEEACARLSDDVSPIDDIRSTAEYRITATRNILRRFLQG